MSKTRTYCVLTHLATGCGVEETIATTANIAAVVVSIDNAIDIAHRHAIAEQNKLYGAVYKMCFYNAQVIYEFVTFANHYDEENSEQDNKYDIGAGA